jgi:hypothetical protein
LAFESAVPLRTRFGKGLLGALVLATAILTVGLTAATDGPFSIVIRPVFLRLGVDLDVKIGTIHVHAGWSALDADPVTTK